MLTGIASDLWVNMFQFRARLFYFVMAILSSQGLGVQPREFNGMLHHAKGQKPLQEEVTLYGDWKLFQPDGGVAVLNVTVCTHHSAEQSTHHDLEI